MLERAAKEVFPACDTHALAMADGGEGTVEAVLSAGKGHWVSARVHGPLGEQIEASYGVLDEAGAIIEMAAASGLPLVPQAQRNPCLTSTRGTGELILDALNRGAQDITVAIGGSATNDGGMGCLQALGARFVDSAGNELDGCGKNLALVDSIDLAGLDARLHTASLTVMCDVTNPLCGENGATRTFAPQKGATPEMVEALEQGMQNYRQVLLKQFGVDCNQVPGSGAAGGLGAALFVALGATMKSGVQTVLDLIGFDQHLAQVDLVVTGEGRSDWQSCFGKVVSGVGERCLAQGVPAIALCGSVGPGYEGLYEHGIRSIVTTVDSPMSLADAMANAEDLYYRAAVRMFRMVQLGMDLRA